MKRHHHPDPAPRLAQVYLLDRDTALLCRILGLYAARGIELLDVDYAYAAQDVMRLSVRVASTDDLAEAVRVLVDKVRTFVGVVAAAVDDSRGTGAELVAA